MGENWSPLPVLERDANCPLAAFCRQNPVGAAFVDDVELVEVLD